MDVCEHLCFLIATFPAPSSPSSCAEGSFGAAAVVNEIEEEFLFCISVSLFFFLRTQIKLKQTKNKVGSPSSCRPGAPLQLCEGPRRRILCRDLGVFVNIYLNNLWGERERERARSTTAQVSRGGELERVHEHQSQCQLDRLNDS